MYSMGGLAEYCVVPANALAIIPESLPYSESAIIGCAVFTAYGAMKNAADMRAGETVAIIGTGGVGSRYYLVRPSLVQLGLPILQDQRVYWISISKYCSSVYFGVENLCCLKHFATMNGVRTK